MSNVFVNPNPAIVATGPARTLLPSESGSIVVFTKAAALTITLPAPTTAGLRYDFVQNGAGAAQTVTIDAGAGLLLGNWNFTNAGGTTAGTPARNLNFLTAASALGDYATFVSNGTHWICRAFTGITGGLSFT